MISCGKTRLSRWIFLIAGFNVAFRLAFYNTLGFHRDDPGDDVQQLQPLLGGTGAGSR